MDDDALRTLAAMNDLADFGCIRYNAHDARALSDACDTVRRALVQPVGCTGDAKRRGAGNVTAAEYDGAVVRIIGVALIMQASGRIPLLENDDEGSRPCAR